MVILIFGSAGEGKTTAMIRLLKQSAKPCVVIDTIKDTVYGKEKGSDKPISILRFDQHCHRIYNASQLEEFKKYKYVYTPLDSEDFENFFLELQQYRNLNIFIDELDMWCSSKYLPNSLYNIFRFSRHWQYDIFCTMRNPYEIHRNIRACANYFWIFKLIEKGHLDYFEHYQDGLSQDIQDLKTGSYQYINVKVR